MAIIERTSNLPDLARSNPELYARLQAERDRILREGDVLMATNDQQVLRRVQPDGMADPMMFDNRPR